MGINELHRFAAQHHGAFSTQEAEGFGITTSQIRRRVESGDFVRLDRGVLGIGGSPPSWMRAARVATLTTGGFLSHASALFLHGIDGFSPGVIEVSIPKSRSVRRPNIHIHRTTQFGRAAVHQVDGIECSSIERSLLDFAGQVGEL